MLGKLSTSYAPFIQGWQQLIKQPLLNETLLCVNSMPLGRLHGALGQAVEHTANALNIPSHRHNGQLNWAIPRVELELTLNQVGLALQNQGLVPHWRDETQTLFGTNGEPLCELERALFKTFGFISQAIHVHASTAEGLIWVGVRDISKKDHPCMLDNVCAGGISTGEAPQQSAWRELFEEAGLTPNQLKNEQLLLQEQFIVSRPHPQGWHHERVHLYCTELMPHAQPFNQDGEMSAFHLMSPHAARLAINQLQFTPDAGLCTALALEQSISF